MREISVLLRFSVPSVGAEPYQRAASDGGNQRIEDVDGQTQQGGPTVNDGLICVVLRGGGKDNVSVLLRSSSGASTVVLHSPLYSPTLGSGFQPPTLEPPPGSTTLPQ